MTYNNTFATPDFEGVGLVIEVPSTNPVADAWFAVTNWDEGLPATVDIADVADANLSALDVFLEAWQEGTSPQGGEIEHSCMRRLTSTPTAFTADFEDTPTITSPAHDAVLTVAQAETMTVSFASVTGGLPGGLGLVGISSEHPGLAVDRVEWTIVIPRGRSSFTLPPTALAMFVPDAWYDLDVEVVATEGSPLDFDVAFNENVAANIQSVIDADQEHLSRYMLSFTTE
jgi:hypothetical protein